MSFDVENSNNIEELYLFPKEEPVPNLEENDPLLSKSYEYTTECSTHCESHDDVSYPFEQVNFESLDISEENVDIKFDIHTCPIEAYSKQQHDNNDHQDVNEPTEEIPFCLPIPIIKQEVFSESDEPEVRAPAKATLQRKRKKKSRRKEIVCKSSSTKRRERRDKMRIYRQAQKAAENIEIDEDLPLQYYVHNIMSNAKLEFNDFTLPLPFIPEAEKLKQKCRVNRKVIKKPELPRKYLEKYKKLSQEKIMELETKRQLRLLHARIRYRSNVALNKPGNEYKSKQNKKKCQKVKEPQHKKSQECMNYDFKVGVESVNNQILTDPELDLNGGVDLSRVKVEVFTPDEESNIPHSDAVGSLEVKVTPEGRLQSVRKYYYKNRDALLKRSREYYRNNSEEIRRKSREYYQMNREDVLTMNANAYRNNIEQHRLRTQKYYQMNRDVVRKKAKEYYRAKVEEKRQMAREDCKTSTDDKIEVTRANCKSGKSASRDYYHRNKEMIRVKRREKRQKQEALQLLVANSVETQLREGVNEHEAVSQDLLDGEQSLHLHLVHSEQGQMDEAATEHEAPPSVADSRVGTYAETHGQVKTESS